MTTKTLEHVVPAYDLPKGAAVDRGKVAQAAQKTAQAEALHAAPAAEPSTAAVNNLIESGRSAHWLKIKNPATQVVKCEAEEDWGRERAGIETEWLR